MKRGESFKLDTEEGSRIQETVVLVTAPETIRTKEITGRDIETYYKKLVEITIV